MSAIDFYQNKIDELEDEYKDRYLTSDEFMDSLEKNRYAFGAIQRQINCAEK